jgi:hypothetical protein
MAWLADLHAALDGAAASVTFFFRDDDAGWRDDRLRALLALFEERALPLDVAVIPAELRPALAEELSERAATGRLGLHQHGLAHVNHEPDGRSCEFGPARDVAVQRADIARGRERLHQLLGERVDPIFTPPWNRCTEATGRCLPELGFAALSREARAEPLALPGLRELPVRVDWFRRRHGALRTRAELGAELAAAVTRPGPVGVMFHHAPMDSAELEAAGELLSLLAGHPRVRCARMATLIVDPGSPRVPNSGPAT